jgi:hypothetical protein
MKPIEVKFSVQLIYIFLFFLYSCNLIEERNLATNKTVRTSCNCDSLQKEVIYNRSVNAYSSIITNSIYDKPDVVSDIFVSQKIC